LGSLLVKKPKAEQAALAPRLLNVAEAASYLGVTIFFMRTLHWEKQVRGLKLGHRLLFDKADLDLFVERAKASA